MGPIGDNGDPGDVGDTVSIFIKSKALEKLGKMFPLRVFVAGKKYPEMWRKISDTVN